MSTRPKPHAVAPQVDHGSGGEPGVAVLGDAEPRDVAAVVHGLVRSGQLPPYDGVEPVGAHQDVGLRHPAVGEVDPGAVALHLEPVGGRVQPDRDVRGPVQEGGEQVGAADADARDADAAGDLGERELPYQPALPVLDVVGLHHPPALLQAEVDVEGGERGRGVAHHGEAESGCPDLRRPLEHLHLEADAPQRDGGGQSADPRADDDGCPCTAHVSSPRSRRFGVPLP